MKKVSAVLAASLFASTAFAQMSLTIDPGQADGSTPRGGPSSCSMDATVSQALDPAAFGTARTADAGLDFLVAETPAPAGTIEMFPDNEQITSVTVWGLQIEFQPGVGFVDSCDPNGADFTIGAWTDDGMGVPDTLLDSATVTPVVTDLGIPFAFTTIVEFQLPINGAIDVTGATHFSVQRQASPDTPGGGQCLFLWVDQTDAAQADNAAIQIELTGPTVTPQPTDQAACVETAFLGATQAVPVNSPWALILMILVIGGLGAVVVRRVF